MSSEALTLTAPSFWPNNLPIQSTSFVGREQEIAEIGRLLAGEPETPSAGPRLLTLTGAGGCGKTRLALQVAEGAARSCPHGAWFVELAAVADPGLVAQAAGTAVGVREVPDRPMTESLVDHLHRKTLLLVLDNCEHVVAGAAQLAETLLRRCPRLRILATSREPLGCPGETTWRVPSLATPPAPTAGQPALEDVTRYEAVRLFVDRARAALPGFAAADRDAPALAEVCHRLDGIPLAIELAAARVRVLSVGQLAARLDDRFRLLTAGPRTALPRQQTLRATVDWSHALLAQPERILLRRLAVFAGGWTLEAAEAVAAGDGLRAPAVLDLLAQLVDKSLVLAEVQGRASRFRLQETIREYALERLEEAGEAARTRDRHLAHCLALAEGAEPRLRGPEAEAALDRLEAEHANFREALEWALRPRGAGGDGGEAALRLAGALAWFWWARSFHSEGRRWLARALAGATGRAAGRSAARAKALHGAGWLAHHQRDSAEARALLGECLAIARERGDHRTEAWALHALGRVAYFEDDPAGARALGRESLAVAEAVGDGWLVAYALHLLGIAAHLEADYPAARDYYERSLAIRRGLRYQEGIGILQALLAMVALREGELSEAHARLGESLAVMRAVMGPWGSAPLLAGFSHLAGAVGQPVRAVRLGAFATALSESHHTPLIPFSEVLLVEGLGRARRVLGEEAYAVAWAEGRALSLEDGVAEALALDAAPAEVQAEAPAAPEPPARGRGPAAGLTPAEHRVLRLLADGRTTKEIAAELVVAVSTVDRHLTHLYAKLGVRNRAQATALALKDGLI